MCRPPMLNEQANYSFQFGICFCSGWILPSEKHVMYICFLVTGLAPMHIKMVASLCLQVNQKKCRLSKLDKSIPRYKG
jgi:hypothetical protein